MHFDEDPASFSLPLGGYLSPCCSTDTMSSFKVIYFPARGRAEATRLALAFNGVAFEDVRLPGAGESSCMESSASARVNAVVEAESFMIQCSAHVSARPSVSARMCRMR